MTDPPTTDSPPGPPWPEKRRRRPWGVAAVSIATLVFVLDYFLGGAQEAGALWVESRHMLLKLLAWEVHFYVWIYVPAVLLFAYLMRHTLPVIEIPVVDDAFNVHWKSVWYWPGSIQILGDELSWREGRRRAYAHKTLVCKTGLFGRSLLAVKRALDVDEVLYTHVKIPPYQSPTLTQRLRIEIQEGVVRAHKERVRHETR